MCLGWSSKAEAGSSFTSIGWLLSGYLSSGRLSPDSPCHSQTTLAHLKKKKLLFSETRMERSLSLTLKALEVQKRHVSVGLEGRARVSLAQPVPRAARSVVTGIETTLRRA